MKEVAMSRQGRTWMAWAVSAALLLAAGAAYGEEAEGDSAAAAPMGLNYSLELTSSFHQVSSAYFGAADWQVHRHGPHYSWGEGLTRARVGYKEAGCSVGFGGVLLGTTGTDYFGTHDLGDGRLDQAFLAVEDLGGSGVGFTFGRQNLQIGDGFVIGDGYYDSRAALWNIPLGYSDAALVGWTRGPWNVQGFASLLSRSWHWVDEESGATFYPQGTITGGEVSYAPSEQRTLALAYFRRQDTGDTKLQPSAFSARGALGQGPLTLSGEWVTERGDYGDGPATDLKAMAGHACLNYALPFKGEPFVEVEHLRFTGDDPGTPEDEAYYPWQYTWSDWSKWYVADLMGSTLVFNSNSRVWRLGCGFTPLENTTVRLLLHRIDLDTQVPEGIGRGFADEADLIVDQSIGDHVSLWVMGAYAVPRDAAKDLLGSSAKSGQLFASISYKFASPGGEE
jgi:hypothetical protein